MTGLGKAIVASAVVVSLFGSCAASSDRVEEEHKAETAPARKPTVFSEDFQTRESIAAHGGTISGNVTSVAGFKGNAVKFAGKDAYITYKDVCDIHKGSIEFMVKTDWKYDVSKPERDNPYIVVFEPIYFCLSLRHKPGYKTSVTGGDPPVYQSPGYSGHVVGVMVGDPENGAPTHARATMTTWLPDTWHHVALTWDFSGPKKLWELRFYVDRELAGTSRYDGPLPKVPPVLCVGGRPGRISRVCIDEFKFWPEPLVYGVAEME